MPQNVHECTVRNATLKADFKHVVFLGSESKFSLCCFIFVVQNMTLWISYLLLHTHTHWNCINQNTNSISWSEKIHHSSDV